jgi:hypothetical protein
MWAPLVTIVTLADGTKQALTYHFAPVFMKRHARLVSGSALQLCFEFLDFTPTPAARHSWGELKVHYAR